MKKFLKFIFAMILAFLPGAIGVMFTPHGMSDVWYNGLTKSALTPAGWVFGAAWTVLYALLGIALFLVMISRTRMQQGKTKAYTAFVFQMILNGLWSYLFFGAHMVLPAFLVIGALILISIWMMQAFFKINKKAAYLIVPYLLWLVFAAYLNGVILFMN